jgi:hypothetical protein
MDNYGMTPEEVAKRQRLIENLIANGNLELAADVAKGPYRINGGGSPNVAPPPQGISDRARGNAQSSYPAPSSAPAGAGQSSSLMKSPTIQSTPTQSPAYQGPVNQYGNMGGPPQHMGNPRYDFPQNATGQPININVTMGRQEGQVPDRLGGAYGPPPQSAGPTQNGLTPYPQYTPLGASSPNYVPPTNTPGQQLETLVGQYTDWMNSPQVQSPMGRTDYAPSAMNQPHYPYSPNWSGQQLYPQPMAQMNQPGLTGADFGPAQQMTDLGVRRGVPMAQIQAPFTDTGWGNLSR